MQTLIVAENPFDPKSWTRHDVASAIEFLVQHFKKWPTTARIYHKQVAESCDVTPKDHVTVKLLDKLEGPLYIVVYPAAPITIVIAVVAVAATLAAVYLLKPSLETPKLGSSRSQSPNNSSSIKQNVQRVNERIPDIFGTVRAIPDLLAVPFTVFKDHQDMEYTYLCLGRGSYAVSDIRDGTTPIADIEDATLEVYGPNTSPVTQNPELRIGASVTDYTAILTVKKVDAVDSLPLLPPNLRIQGSYDMRGVGPDTIEIYPGSDLVFSDVLNPGDQIVLTGLYNYQIHQLWFYKIGGGIAWPQPPDGHYDGEEYTEGGVTYVWHTGLGGVDLAGTYTLASVTDKYAILANPSNAWRVTTTTYGWGSPTITTTKNRWVGPYVIDDPSTTCLHLNFAAPSGLYKVDSNGQHSETIVIDIEAAPISADGTPTGDSVKRQVRLVGSSTVKKQRGLTVKIDSLPPSRYSITAKRATTADWGWNGQIVDDVRWRDLYGVIPESIQHFGNITTVLSVVNASSSYSSKERRINMLATRKLMIRNGDTFSGSVATNRADEILSNICLDSMLGNRPVSDLDLTSIYDSIASVEDYFGTDLAISFNHTFDDKNMSLEEMITSVAGSVFCVPYRQGAKLKLKPELATEDSVLLFNHRNKLPETEVRTITFGTVGDNDGVEVEYVNPDDGITRTISFPSYPTSPKKIETIGVRSRLQAYFHACRAYNKLRYQNVGTEFDATQEASMLVLQDRVLVADNTRSDTQDGEVLAQDVLELTLSQRVTFGAGSHTIFLQHIDGTVEAMAVTSGTAPNKVVIERSPRLPLAIDDNLYAKATYLIVSNVSTRERAFLVSEKSPKDNFTITLRLVNYDARYYANDLDYANNIVDAEGYPV